jgi:hypothetical protein
MVSKIKPLTKETLKMETTRTPERRIDSRIRLMRIAGMLCALFAGIGIADGIHQASPDSGWIVPVLAGIVIAPALAIFWHVVIGTVVGMIRLTMIVALFVAAIVVTAISLGASAQSIATAIAGRAALAAELSAVVDGYNQKLAKAYAEATGWSGIATSAGAKAAGYATQAETESGGSNGYGKGCGPRCASLRDISAAFRTSQQALNGLLKDASDEREKGDADMAAMRDAAARGDQNGFMAATEGVSQTIARLNAIDPRPIIVNTGAVVVSKKGIDLSKDTADFQATANKALANRQTVASPVFTPMSLGEATRKQILGAAMHGWILASAIDLLPLFFLILAFVLSREVWLNEEVIREKVTHEGQDGTDRQRLDSLMGRARTVVPFKASGQ